MPKHALHIFSAIIDIIGINPFVFVPEDILQAVFRQAGKDKGFIPIKGTINKKPYTQTLVRYSGEWRLYINTTMLKDSPKRIGEQVDVTIAYDPADRSIPMHPKLEAALQKSKKALAAFNTQSPSRQKEIVRYIATLKSEEARDKNITRAINFLLGKERFAGRDKP